MQKKIVGHSYNKILLSNKKEQTTGVHNINNLRNITLREKSARKENIL